MHQIVLRLAAFAAIAGWGGASPAQQEVAQTVYAKVAPSVVLIIVEDGRGKATSQGSGFVIDGNLIVTNAHVVRGGTAFVQTGVAKVPCTVSRIDERQDLAVLRATIPLTAPALRAAPANTLIGTRVFALGNPQGLERTITEGLYTGPRNFDGVTLLQISAAISPGSSGGPIVDSNGFVVGIAVSSLESGQNLNFAVPVDTLLSLLARPEMTAAATRPSAPAVQPVPPPATAIAPARNASTLSTAAALQQFYPLMQQREAIRVTRETTQQWLDLRKRERDLLAAAINAARNDDELMDVHSAATHGHNDIALDAAKMALQRTTDPKPWHYFGIAAAGLAFSEVLDEPRKTEILNEARAAVLKGVAVQGGPKGWLLAGQIHSALKDWKPADAAFRLAQTAGIAAEDRAALLRGMWRSALGLNQAADAERLYGEFDKTGTADDDDLRVRADQLLAQNKFADAAAGYERLAGRPQSSVATAAQLWYSAAYSRWLAGDNDAASKDAVRAIALADPVSVRATAQAHALIANILMTKGDHELASEAARRAVATDATYPWGHVQLARALNLIGRAAEAEAPARKAVALNDKSGEAHFVLASAYFLQKKWDLALPSYEQAARLDASDAYAAYNAGLSLENLGRLKEALVWYEDTLRRAPQMKERDQVLASIARVRGKG